jgi:hypothetical protein
LPGTHGTGSKPKWSATSASTSSASPNQRKRKDEIFMKQHAALDVDVSDLAELEKDLEDFGKNDKAGASDGDKVSANAYTGTAPPKL